VDKHIVNSKPILGFNGPEDGKHQKNLKPILGFNGPEDGEHQKNLSRVRGCLTVASYFFEKFKTYEEFVA
jgi:hypothetical protein